ncbi:MAG: hypothetical protein GY738_21845 [Pseudoalteromonas sp.]|nr:hypothetical protein [Pseudoalteromonas sp.]
MVNDGLPTEKLVKAMLRAYGESLGDYNPWVDEMSYFSKEIAGFLKFVRESEDNVFK